MTASENLPAEIAAEIAALPPFVDYDDAVAKVDELRGKYLDRLKMVARFEKKIALERHYQSIPTAIANQCSHVIARQAVLHDLAMGSSSNDKSTIFEAWSSSPPPRPSC